jgi:hypothetical protein
MGIRMDRTHKSRRITKKIGKPLAKMLKEKQKTIKLREHNQRKTLKQTEKNRIKMQKVKAKLHRKAVKARKKNVEKRLDWLLAGSCFLVCLAASLVESGREKKQKKQKAKKNAPA